MDFDKNFFENVFSRERLEKYFIFHRGDESMAMLHYRCNIELAESLYPCLSVLEVSLRNAISRELEKMTGRKDWYMAFQSDRNLFRLNRHIERACSQIVRRNEYVRPDKVVAELTLGFWVSLFNSEYERLFWKDLRRAFPFMPKNFRQRKNVSAPLNNTRKLRNRVFHNEPVGWNLVRLNSAHDQIVMVIGWIDEKLPAWLRQLDKFSAVCRNVRELIEPG